MSMNPYTSREWRTFRAEYLRVHPYCSCTACAQHGKKLCMRKADTVDHVTPARAGNVTRFAAMCHSCHSRKTAKYDGGFGNP